jgi:hypothetical protein
MTGSLLLVCREAHANGVNWLHPQTVIPYEIGVVIIEGIVLGAVFRPGIVRAVALSFAANLLSWIVGVGIALVSGIAIAISVPFRPEAIFKMAVYDAGVQFLLLFSNILVEAGVLLRCEEFEDKSRLFSVIVFMNLFTWGVGFWMFSTMVG